MAVSTKKETKCVKTREKERMELKFSKEQILNSARYIGNRDLVDALLEEDKSYSYEMVENLMEKYRKGKVK